MLWKVTRADYDAAADGVRKLLCQLRGEGDEGDDEGAQGVDRMPFFSQLGVAARPLLRVGGVAVRTLHALGLDVGNDVAVIKMWDVARTPTDLDEGETRLFSAGTIANAIRMLADRIAIEAPQIRLGAAATKKVNREGDALRPGTLSFTATSSTLTIVYTPPDGGSPQEVSIAVGGSPAVLTPFTTRTITLGGKTGPGSDKVRAED